MATSYSTNLALTLQGTGDNPGTWGDITNTNLGTLLEQAISGYVTQAVATGTDTTITIPNGSTGVARNMYIELTGTGGTNTNLIVPSNKKLYFIYNNTSSGQVTVKVSGQTGVSVANGEKVILVSNGTDVAIAAGTNISGFTTSAVTALGINAGDSVTSATKVTAIGYDAGTAITSGNTTAVGYSALKLVSTGTSNTALGVEAGDAITTADANTVIGNSAGGAISIGSGNTCVGNASGTGITTGALNCAIGDSSYPSGNYSNSTCLGYNSGVDGSNQVQAGNSSTTLYYYAATQRASDSRDKADIQDTTFGLDFIMKLRPRMYRWDYREDYRPPKPADDASEAEWEAWQEACKLSNLTHDGSKKRVRLHHGLIAQELKQVMDEMGVDFAGYQDFKIDGGDDRLTVVYNELIAPMIKAIQELKAEFDEYKRTHP